MNQWMIMRRPMANALKQKWKDFIVWLVNDQGFANLRIDCCEIECVTYYGTNRRHDADAASPKFILDGLVDSGIIEDDDMRHIKKIILWCDIDASHPRTEIIIRTKE